jgi:hypothetical protein
MTRKELEALGFTLLGKFKDTKQGKKAHPAWNTKDKPKENLPTGNRPYSPDSSRRRRSSSSL